MSAVLDRMTPGFADPVHDAQRTFRLVLDAMSRPGSLRRLQHALAAAIVPPPSSDPARPMSVAAAAILLALLDADTSVDLVGSLRTESALAFLRFHTGVRPTATIDAAAFTVVRAADADAALCTRLYLGSDEAPQSGVTVVVEVDGFDGFGEPTTAGSGPVTMTLRGPGIETTATLLVTGLDRAFWNWRVGLQAELPRGVDLVLTHGNDVVAIPRSTRITLED